MSTHPENETHAIEEVGAAGLSSFTSAAALSEQTDDRTAKECGGSTGGSFTVTGTGSGEQTELPGKT